MTAALRVVAKEKKISESWAGITKIALYTGKRDTRACPILVPPPPPSSSTICTAVNMLAKLEQKTSPN